MKRCLLLLVSLFGLTHPFGAMAAPGRWRDLPPEERQEMRQQMREHWQQDNLRHPESRNTRWRELPPEERRQLREEMREQRSWRGTPGESMPAQRPASQRPEREPPWRGD